jgi:hypothetical protein
MTITDQTKTGNTLFQNKNKKRYFSVIWVVKNVCGFTLTRIHASLARCLSSSRILLTQLLYTFDFSRKFLT